MQKCLECPYHPLTELPVFTVEAVAGLLGIKPASVRKALWRHSDKLKAPAYRRGKDHPRKLRVLYPSDVKTLVSLCVQWTSFFRTTEQLKKTLAHRQVDL